jgi:hypothetical protein
VEALSAGLMAYQRGVDAMRESLYMDFPKHVHLETMAVCNAACNFCPYPALDRQGTRMPDELIAKIIDDLTVMPQTLRFQFSPFKVNEPFLDVRLFDILRYVNHRLPNADITLTTNATPLTENQIARLAAVKNLGYLWISMNDHRAAEYEATMRLPYARTIERLRALHAAKSEGWLGCEIVVSRVGDRSAADAEFVAWVRRSFPLFEPAVTPRGNWISQVDVKIEPPPAVGCGRWFELSITATGIVAHCCMDGQAAYLIGDVSRQHVLEVYNAPEYRRLREATATREGVTPCNGCSFM